jgi:hypothetical protein
VADDGVSMEIASMSALALGFVFVGSGNGEVASTILQTLMEREEKVLGEKWGRFMVLGLALLYLGGLGSLSRQQSHSVNSFCRFAGLGCEGRDHRDAKGDRAFHFEDGTDIGRSVFVRWIRECVESADDAASL